MADKPAATWRPIVHRRLTALAGVLLLWSVAIQGRLVNLQVLQHADLSMRAERQQQRTIESPAERGDILDRHGRILAYSVDADTIYAVPTEIADPAAAASAVCGALQDCSPRDRQAIAERIGRGRHFAYVRRQITPEQARRVAALNLDGIGFMKEHRRYYPNKEMAAHLLGYVGVDGTGLGGIEAAYDPLIKGRAGAVLIQTDARRQAFSRVERPSSPGDTLELTVDQYLQHIAERELRAGIDWSRAESGSVVIMDPVTGEILALANYPTFNPNTYRDFRQDLRRNRAVQDFYEPGSTFKIVTASAALEERVVSPDEPIDVSQGLIRLGSRVIRDDRRHDVLSFEDVIVRSSNVGAIKVGLRVGAERLTAYARGFGFGRPLSPDFRGESAGKVWDPSKLDDSALASVSMGHQVGVTPLQMAAAVGAVANGGELVEPRLVRAVIREGTRLAVPRKVLGRSINAGTAAQVTQMLEAVVARGTARQAQIPGYTVAGKTGTTQKLVNGRYSRSDYDVSFVGFVPSRNPVFAIVVVIDTPRAVSPYGGVVAAPIFQRIAAAALRHGGIPPNLNPAPPLLVDRGRTPRERPVAGPIDPPSLHTRDDRSAGDASGFPDLTGMSGREAVHVLVRLGVNPHVHGAGLVVAQRPAVGAPLEPGQDATVWLARHAPRRSRNPYEP